MITERPRYDSYLSAIAYRELPYIQELIIYTQQKEYPNNDDNHTRNLVETVYVIAQ